MAEAINATNINGIDDGCNASVSGGTDGIGFNIGNGTPIINVTTPLPTITAAVAIDGATGQGGATRVEIRGPGGTPASGQHGFTITGNSVSISNMVINSFRDDGIFSSGTNTRLLGNIIGMNSSGTLEMANLGWGVEAQGTGAVIGGATDGNDCSGTCNLITGNAKDGVLIDVNAANAVVKGNFIGTNISGTAETAANHYGIAVR